MLFRTTPLEKLNEAVALAAAALAARDEVKAAVVDRRQELSRRNARVRTLKSLLRQDERNFTKFDRITLPSLIYGVLGTRDRRRQEEYDHWLNVRQWLLEAMAARDALVDEVKALQMRATYLQDAPNLLKSALERKEDWLRNFDPAAKGRLWQLDQGQKSLRGELAKIEKVLSTKQRQVERAKATAKQGGSSILANQLLCLEELRRRKTRHLKLLAVERRHLLYDGANMNMRLVSPQATAQA